MKWNNVRCIAKFIKIKSLLLIMASGNVSSLYFFCKVHTWSLLRLYCFKILFNIILPSTPGPTLRPPSFNINIPWFQSQVTAKRHTFSAWILFLTLLSFHLFRFKSFTISNVIYLLLVSWYQYFDLINQFPYTFFFINLT